MKTNNIIFRESVSKMGGYMPADFVRIHPSGTKQTENLKKVFHDAMKYYKPKN